MEILIVSTFFPPAKTVAVVRVSSFVRYLLAQGHHVSVITGQMPERRGWTPDGGLAGLGDIIEVSPDKTQRYFRRSAVYAEALRDRLRTHPTDAVFITCGTYETVPLCSICRDEFHVRCVLDFRDLWLYDKRAAREYWSPQAVLRRILFAPVERKAIHAADAVITVTEGWADILRRVYKRDRDKIFVVENGYDDLLFAGITDEERAQAKALLGQIPDPEHAVILASFGKFLYYSYDYGRMLLSAAKTLLAKHPDLYILHIGAMEEPLTRAVKETGFPADHLICPGFCPYQVGVEMLKYADATLLVDIRAQAIGTKIYDYIFVDRPVLYCGPAGTYLSDMVGQFAGGFSCQTEAQAVEAVETVLGRGIKTLTEGAQAGQYSRTKRNEQLAAHLLGGRGGQA